MTETSQKPFQIQTAWNKAAFWLRHSLECIFSATQIDSFHDCQDGIPVRYRTEGGLFNLRRLKDVIKVKETVIRDFLFAADCMKWTAYLKAVTTSALPTAPKMKSCIRLHLAECNSDPIKVRVRIKAVESEFLFGPDWKKWDPVFQKTINIP